MLVSFPNHIFRARIFHAAAQKRSESIDYSNQVSVPVPVSVLMLSSDTLRTEYTQVYTGIHEYT